MRGLKRGTVCLQEHDPLWEEEAHQTIAQLERILGDAAADIQHVGSTAVFSICAKPIIDIVIGMQDILEIDAFLPALDACGIIDRGEVQPGQHLLVMGDFAQDQRTHHIYVVTWNKKEWQNYIRFRDYLNAFPERAKMYEELKLSLAGKYANDRKAYTEGKKAMIDQLLHEANAWKSTAKAILICGRIACGKTVYAEKLCRENRAVNLSCDELMLKVFGDTLSMKFDEVSGRCKRYLYDKALELLACGTNVVLDWGFWSPAERRYARKMFADKGFDCEIHYVYVSDEVWRKNIAIRNQLVADGKCDAYPVDEELLEKLLTGFRAPMPQEVDVFYENNW